VEQYNVEQYNVEQYNVEQYNEEVGESDFDQLSLNLPHCTALQTDIEPKYPWTRFDTRVVRFVLSSRYTTGIAEH